VKINLLRTLALVCVFASAFNVKAVEGGMGHYVPGAYSDFSDVPPVEPGIYAGNAFHAYANGEFNGSKQLPVGGILAVGVTENVYVYSPSIVYAYPWQIGNFTFASGIDPSWVWQDVTVSASYDRNGIKISDTRAQSVNGFGDLMATPVMSTWTNGDFKVGGMFNLWAPTGNFDVGQLANPGSGYWTFEPMLAFSWLSSKIGTEFTVFPAVDFNTINHNTDYKSGDIFHVDATLAQHLPLFGGSIGAGASVSYMDQFTGDSGSGAKRGSFEMQSVAVGPTVSYVHKLGKSSVLVVDGSWLPQVHTVNTLKGNFYWARLSISF
jgi:hypothetical protein